MELQSKNLLSNSIHPPCNQTRLVSIAAQTDFYDSLDDNSKLLAQMEAYKFLKEDTTLMYQSIMPDDSILLAFYAAMQQDDIGKLQDVKDYLEQGDTSNATTSNNDVSETKVTLINCKYVNEIYLQTWVKQVYIFDSIHHAVLEEIAFQNAADGGACVYTARVMLGIYYDYNDEESERSIADSHFVNKTLTSSAIFIYPNPAQDVITIQNLKPSQVVYIKEFSGKTVLTFNVSNNVEQISLSNLAAGMYLIQINDQKELIYQSKLAIIK